MRASLLCALCALGAAVPAPIKDTVLTITPPSADRAHDHTDGPTHGGATGANATDTEASPETLTAKSEAGAAASPETHDATQAGATASASLIDAAAPGSDAASFVNVRSDSDDAVNLSADGSAGDGAPWACGGKVYRFAGSGKSGRKTFSKCPGGSVGPKDASACFAAACGKMESVHGITVAKKDTETDASWPSGCYYSTYSHKVWFNHATNAAKQDRARLICEIDSSSTKAKATLAKKAPGICGTNQHVSNGKCVACPPGTTSSGGDDPSKGDDTGCVCASTWTLRGTYGNCGKIPRSGELVVHACVDKIARTAYYNCDKIKKVTFKHTVSNPVIIEENAFGRSGVEIVDVPPRATFKEWSFRWAKALKRLEFRKDSDYQALKIEAQAFGGSGLRSKEYLLCAPLIHASTPPSG